MLWTRKRAIAPSTASGLNQRSSTDFVPRMFPAFSVTSPYECESGTTPRFQAFAVQLVAGGRARVAGEVGVGPRHALRSPRGARRIEDHGEIVVRALDGGERVRLVREPLVPVAADENAGPGQPSTFAASSGAVITTFAAESARMWRTSSGERRNTIGTITAPVLRMPV